MLKEVCLKRFILPLVCFLVSIICFWQGEKLDGAIAALLLFVVIPVFFISLIWAICTAIRDVYRVKVKGESSPEEVTPAIGKMKRNIRETSDELAGMDQNSRKHFFLYYFLGVIGVVLGLAVIVFGFIVIGTLILIAGGTMFVLASPRNYNNASDTTKMLSCSKSLTIEELYHAFYKFDTPLGTPYIGRIRFIKSDALIFGPNKSGEYIYLYKNRSGARLYVVENYVESLILEHKTEPLRKPGKGKLGKSGETGYSAGLTMLMMEIFDKVQFYLETGKVQPAAPSK